MPGPVTSSDSPSAIVRTAPTAERELHRQLLLENIDFLIDTLTAEHVRRQRSPPVGCPRATPENVARNRTKSGDPCRYHAISPGDADINHEACQCGDPLTGSDDPLDAVAAVVLGRDVAAPAERFFEGIPRETIANLREIAGSWTDIANMGTEELTMVLEEASPRKGVSAERVTRVKDLLEAVQETHYTDGATLCGFSRVPYSTYITFLTSLPRIDEGDAFWLLQTAFDKPVWPVDPLVDELLCSLGLISPDEYPQEAGERASLAERLVDRQIPILYRALATHAVCSGPDECRDGCEIQKFLLTHRLRKQSMERSGPTVVDLFAGAGGLSCGLSRAGYDIRWAVDIDPDAVATYRLNHPEIPHENVVCGDVCEFGLSASIREAVSDPDVVVGGPPCQSLSKAGYRSRRASDEEYSVLDDDRTTLYTKYVEAVDELRPKAIVMENVEGMINEVGDTGVHIIDWVIEDLKALGDRGNGYEVEFRLQDMTELGIPQHRERVLLVGIREDLVECDNQVESLLDQLSRTDYVRSILEGLSGLPRLCRGEGGRVLPRTPRGRKSEYVKQHRLNKGTQLCFNHQAREHPMEKDRILFDEGLEPGDTSWDLKFNSDGEYAEYIEYDVGTEENPRFRDKYRKLKWSEPAPTIVAHLAKDSNGFVLPDFYEHGRPDPERADPERNRGLTPREAARLQSFPDDYVFLGSFTSWFRQIGNAVPPIAGEVLGKALLPVMMDDAKTEARLQSPADLPMAEASSDD